MKNIHKFTQTQGDYINITFLTPCQSWLWTSGYNVLLVTAANKTKETINFKSIHRYKTE